MCRFALALSLLLTVTFVGCSSGDDDTDSPADDDPTATAGATGSPRAAGTEELTVEAFGFTQDPDGANTTYGVVIVNESGLKAANDIDVEITFLNDAGEEVGDAYETFPSMLPGERTGVGGLTFVQDAVATEMRVALRFGEFADWDSSVETFSFHDITYEQIDRDMGVTGTVTSPFDADLEDVRLDSVLFNAAGHVVGGGYAYVDSLPGGEPVAFDMEDLVGVSPETVEAFAHVSYLTIAQGD